MNKYITKKNVEENLILIRDNAIKVVPSLLEMRVFGGYQNGNWNPEESDVDIMMLLTDEKYSALNISKRDEKTRHLLCQNIFQGVEDEFRRREDLKLVTLFDMDYLIGCDEGKGDFGKAMYKGDLFYRKLPLNPGKLLKYFNQRRVAGFG